MDNHPLPSPSALFQTLSLPPSETPASLVATPTSPPSLIVQSDEKGEDRFRRSGDGLDAKGRPAMEKRQSVVTFTSHQVATSTSNASSATKVPIAPIVGGVIAGVVFVLVVGGVWYWCHMKGVKEAEERRQRKAARAARAAATAAGKTPPGLTSRVKSDQSVNSLSSLNNGGGEKMIPLGGVGGGSHARGGSNASGQSGHSVPYGNGPQYPQQQQGGGHDQYGGQPGGYADPTSPSAGSSSGSSSRSNDRSKKSRHQTSASNASSVSDPPNSADPLRRYQPAKPSPLAAGAVRAAPRPADDGPKWGQGPFRNKSEDDHQQLQQQQQLAYPQSQGQHPDPQNHRKTMMSDASDYGGASSAYDGHPSGGMYSGNAGLAPPIEEEVLASDGSRGRSGEWSVAYSGGGGGRQGVQDSRGGQYDDGQHYQQQNQYVSEPSTTQPQRSNYHYAASSPPRSMGAQEDQYGYHQYQQDMPPSSVPDPYAGYDASGQGGGRQAVNPYGYIGGNGSGGESGASGPGGYGGRI